MNLKKIRLSFEYLLTIFRRKRKTIIIAFLALFFVVGISIYFSKFFLKPSFSEGIIGTYTDRDLPPLVTGLISGSLIEVDETGTPKPGLAQEWEVNPDATIYKLKLRDNLFWTDGTKLKASDIDITIPGAEVNTPNDNTLEFKLVDSFSPFLTLLNKPILKKNSNLVGVGPFRVIQVKRDGVFVKRLTLKALKDGQPEVVIKLYPSERIAKNALKLGEIQALWGVSEMEDLETQSHLKLYNRVNYGQLVTIFYNTKDAILSDENFRLALGFAAPSVKGEVEAVTSVSPKSWAFNEDVKNFLDNPEVAKSDFKKVKNGKDSTITLTATSSLQDVGEEVVNAWNKNGIKAVLRVESGIPQNFQALLITQKIPSDPDQYSLWHSTQDETNISKYSSPRVDKDLEDGRKAKDMETRKARYQDFQKVLLDHAPATFLYFPKYNVVYFKKIEDMFKGVLDLQISQI